MPESAEIRIGKKAFITTAIIILCLMILSGVLTQVIPPGSYERVEAEGKVFIDPHSFHYTEKSALPVYRWFTAPVEVLYASQNSPVVIVLSLLILFIGGGYAVLNRVGVFKEIIAKIVSRFGKKRYLLICIISLVFMFFGSTLGMFEEVVALAPLVVILAYNMGWDALIGLGMSLLSICFGFAVAISNPYSVGLSQRMAGLPVFSGASFRLLVFAILYALLCFFLVRYAKRIDGDPRRSLVYAEDREMRASFNRPAGDTPDLEASDEGRVNKAVAWFLCCFGGILAVIATANLVPWFSDFSMPAIALLYLIAGVGAGLWGGLRGREVARTFLRGRGRGCPGYHSHPHGHERELHHRAGRCHGHGGSLRGRPYLGRFLISCGLPHLRSCAGNEFLHRLRIGQGGLAHSHSHTAGRSHGADAADDGPGFLLR